MDTNGLINNLEFEYHSTAAANPNWEMSLWDFLVSQEVKPDDIWGYSRQIGWDAEQKEPDWV